MNSIANRCPICEKQLENDTHRFEQHVNSHLDKDEEELSRRVAIQVTEASENQSPSNPNQQPHHVELIGPAERMMKEVEENDAILATALSQGDDVAREGVLISQSLRGSLSDSAEQYYPHIMKRVLRYYESVPLLSRKKAHICSSLYLFSSNIAGLGWDCGYRNIQMLFSALLKNADTASELRAAGVSEVPSIPEIAGRIEHAWSKGFDPEGAANFGSSLTDKAVWIGATEAFVLFRSMNMNAYVTDFETPTAVEKRGMFEWIFKHFDQSCNDRHCSVHRKHAFVAQGKAGLVSPIFCQWQGHSVTIIGAEKTRSGDIFLVVLDPSRGFYTQLMYERGLRLTPLYRDIRHSQFQQPRFQFVSVMPKKVEPIAPKKQQTWKSRFSRKRGGAPS